MKMTVLIERLLYVVVCC